MRVDIAVRAAAAVVLLQAPRQRKIRIDDPVLRIPGPVMVDLTQRAFSDHFTGQRHCRNPAVVMADHVNDFGFLGRRQHGLRLLDAQCQRLFAQHMLAVLRGGNRNLRMAVVGRADIHDINERGFHQFAPVGAGPLPSQLSARRLQSGRGATADRLHLHMRFEREEVGSLPPGIGVGFAHETISHHTDAQGSRHIKLGLN